LAFYFHIKLILFNSSSGLPFNTQKLRRMSKRLSIVASKKLYFNILFLRGGGRRRSFEYLSTLP
jgi:hypothetical protein